MLAGGTGVNKLQPIQQDPSARCLADTVGNQTKEAGMAGWQGACVQVKELGLYPADQKVFKLTSHTNLASEVDASGMEDRF